MSNVTTVGSTITYISKVDCTAGTRVIDACGGSGN